MMDRDEMLPLTIKSVDGVGVDGFARVFQRFRDPVYTAIAWGYSRSAPPVYHVATSGDGSLQWHTKSPAFLKTLHGGMPKHPPELISLLYLMR